MIFGAAPTISLAANGPFNDQPADPGMKLAEDIARAVVLACGKKGYAVGAAVIDAAGGGPYLGFEDEQCAKAGLAQYAAQLK